MKPAKRPWLVLAVLCVGTFAVLLDTTIVNVALPSLISGLHASLDQALWVVNGYLLVSAALLIVAGRLGDLFGPRRMFAWGLALFAVASAGCGAAQAPGQLIAARAVQGIGAAALTPQAMVIIQRVFPREKMGAAFGVSFSMIGLAAVSGPALGAARGLQVGSGQPGARVPAGTPAPLAAELGGLIHDVFARAYIAAMHPALAVSVALLLAGALGCLLLRRADGPVPGPASAATGRPAPRAAAPTALPAAKRALQ